MCADRDLIQGLLQPSAPLPSGWTAAPKSKQLPEQIPFRTLVQVTLRKNTELIIRLIPVLLPRQESE